MSAKLFHKDAVRTPCAWSTWLNHVANMYGIAMFRVSAYCMPIFSIVIRLPCYCSVLHTCAGKFSTLFQFLTWFIFMFNWENKIMYPNCFFCAPPPSLCIFNCYYMRKKCRLPCLLLLLPLEISWLIRVFSFQNRWAWCLVYLTHLLFTCDFIGTCLSQVWCSRKCFSDWCIPPEKNSEAQVIYFTFSPFFLSFKVNLYFVIYDMICFA